MEMGKLMLDINRPDAALQAFENVLRFDRAFPGHDSSAGMRGDWSSWCAWAASARACAPLPLGLPPCVPFVGYRRTPLVGYRRTPQGGGELNQGVWHSCGYGWAGVAGDGEWWQAYWAGSCERKQTWSAVPPP